MNPATPPAAEKPSGVLEYLSQSKETRAKLKTQAWKVLRAAKPAGIIRTLSRSCSRSPDLKASTCVDTMLRREAIRAEYLREPMPSAKKLRVIGTATLFHIVEAKRKRRSSPKFSKMGLALIRIYSQNKQLPTVRLVKSKPCSPVRSAKPNSAQRLFRPRTSQPTNSARSPCQRKCSEPQGVPDTL